MRISELLRLVWLNINQNRLKSIMTSIGIVVGAATIVMVIAIGRGSQMDVAEQFSSLNAGAIDISYEYEEEASAGGGGGGGGFSFGGISDMLSGGFSNITNLFSGGGRGGGAMSDEAGGDRNGAGGGMPGGNMGDAGGMGGGPMGNAGGGGMADRSGFADMFSGGDFNVGDIADAIGGGDFNVGDIADAIGGGDFNIGDIADAIGGGDFDVGDIADAIGGGDFNIGDIADAFSNGDFNAEDIADAFGNGDFNAEDIADALGSGDFNLEDIADAFLNGESELDSEAEEESEELAAAENDAADEESEEEDVSAEDGVTDELSDRMNQEKVILTEEDVDDIELFVPGLSGATISYSSRASVEGGNLTEAATYTVAGVYDSYYTVSNLKMAQGEFLTEEDSDNRSRVCVLGSSVAKELFGSAAAAVGELLYLDDRAYTVVGVLASASTVSANITPDDSIFIPYQTGIKYITGTDISPVITVISEDVNAVSDVIARVETVLAESYSMAEFTFEDAGSKMEAAESSNEILTLLLTAMAVIVFIVGGIGIMNVLFVTVRERTPEIGILKALGASRSSILFEFLFESAAISLIGGLLGVGISFAVTPLIEYYGIRVEANMTAWTAALLFSVLTGTIFGFYPAWQASKLVPVEALNAD